MKIILVQLRVHDSTDIETVEDAERYFSAEIPIDFEKQVIDGICGVIDIDTANE